MTTSKFAFISLLCFEEVNKSQTTVEIIVTFFTIIKTMYLLTQQNSNH